MMKQPKSHLDYGLRGNWFTVAGGRVETPLLHAFDGFFVQPLGTSRRTRYPTATRGSGQLAFVPYAS
jgi:hypothetical protein